MRFLFLVATLLSGLVLPGCDSSGGCAAYCEKYQKCVDENTNVSECTDVCQSWAEDSDSRLERTVTCGDCVAARSCSSAIGSCLDECTGVPGVDQR